jgi:uncharacterized protein YvpB
MKFVCQAIGLLLVFLGTVFKETSWDKLSFLKGLYWPAVVAGLTVGVVGVRLDYKDAGVRDAIALADQGRLTFHSGLDNQSLTTVEDAVRQLDRAQEALARFGETGKRLQATHDLALAQERLAYGDNAYGCAFRRDEDGDVYSCRRHSGATIYVVPRVLEGWNIRCTDVKERPLWDQARNSYHALTPLLLNSSTQSSDNLEEVARASRSAAYFLLCDRLRFGGDELGTAEQLLRLAERVTSANGMTGRNEDARKKLLFVNAAARLPKGEVSCSETCADDVEPNSRYFEFRGQQLTSFRGDKTVYEDGVQTLPSCGSQDTGTLVSDVIRPPRTFKSAVLSWDATTPPGTWLEFRIRARVDGNWTNDYRLGEWSSGDHDHRHSFDGQRDGKGDVRVDELVLSEPADSLQLVAELHRLPAGSSHSGRPAPQLRALSVVLSGPRDPVPKLEPLRTAVDIDVPPYSQMTLSNGDVLCSPTSLSMVLDYWARELNLGSLQRPILEVADRVDDPKYGHGNWSFNVAYAALIGNGQLRAFVTRLASIEQLERLLVEGIPTIASIRWKPNTLHGAPVPLSNGHLLVVRGFDKSGNVIVNDPAARKDDEVKRIYNRGEFDSAWSLSGRTVYVVHPSAKSLPDEGGFGSW